jgi:hypothetical protein
MQGAVCLAAYRPQSELFRRQLISIQNQTVRTFTCLIGADGGMASVEELVRSVVGDDPRFTVIGFGTNVGFYRNFERILAESPSDAEWIALCDQDDEWKPNKLEVLISHLADTSMVSCQARLTEYPSGRVLASSTNRRNVDPLVLTIDNQFTGAFCVFRRELLDLALPFPVWNGPTAAHDHWLALCATFAKGTRVVDDVLQDYVQHDSNVMGENETAGSGFDAAESARNIRSISRRYEGAAGVLGILRTVYKLVVGWREAMVDSLAERLAPTHRLEEVKSVFGHPHNVRATLAFLNRCVSSGIIPARTRMEFLAGWAAGSLVGGRVRAEPAGRLKPVIK